MRFFCTMYMLFRNCSNPSLNSSGVNLYSSQLVLSFPHTTRPKITKPTHIYTHNKNPHKQTHILQNPHIHPPTHSKTHIYTHILQNPHLHTTHTLENPHITKPKHTRTDILQNHLKPQHYKIHTKYNSNNSIK